LRRLFSAIRHRKLHLARSVGFKTERYNQAVSYDIKNSGLFPFPKENSLILQSFSRLQNLPARRFLRRVF
ncbi:MAG: hypothetical protein LBR83_08705, partial [Clostridiales bacterium]|nr:hypothetical protein [Clostridiales bacterium]